MKLISALSALLSIGVAASNTIKNERERKTQSTCKTGMTPPLKTSTCWSYNVQAQNTPLQKGCDNAACAAAVCACDSYCCDMSWDMSCRGYSADPNKPKDNPMNPGCAASVLCCEDDLYNDANSGGSPTPPAGGSPTSPIDCYSDFNSLNAAMKAGANQPGTKEYIVCPGAYIDLNEKNSIVPYADNTIVKCGADGSSANNCIVSNAETHVLFRKNVPLKDVKFQGLSMMSSTGISVAGYSPAGSTARFVDCHWKYNTGDEVVFISADDEGRRRKLRAATSANGNAKLDAKFRTLLVEETTAHRKLQATISISSTAIATTNTATAKTTTTTQGATTTTQASTTTTQEATPSMTMYFDACSFMGNSPEVGLILVDNGTVYMNNCNVDANNAEAITVGVARGGNLVLDTKTQFSNNYNGFSIIFVDKYSQLQKGSTISGKGNSATKCEGLFYEGGTSDCLGSGGTSDACTGYCCDFSGTCGALRRV